MLALLARAALFALSLSLGGCIIYSVNPINAPGTDLLDPQLAGNWQLLENDVPQPAYIAIRKAGNYYNCYLVSQERDGIDVDIVTAHTSKVGNQQLLNIRMPSDEHPGYYMFARYTINHDRFVYRLLDFVQVPDDIKNGLVPGKSDDTLTLLTATPAELSGYFSNYDRFAADFGSDTQRTETLPEPYKKALDAYIKKH